MISPLNPEPERGRGRPPGAGEVSRRQLLLACGRLLKRLIAERCAPTAPERSLFGKDYRLLAEALERLDTE